MSFKELKRLAPWGWESKSAMKKGRVGRKGLEEWEQIQRSLMEGDCEVEGSGNAGARNKSAVSKRLRNKDACIAGLAPPSPELSLDLTTPGHTTTKKKSLQPLLTSTPTAAQAAAESTGKLLPYNSSSCSTDGALHNQTPAHSTHRDAAVCVAAASAVENPAGAAAPQPETAVKKAAAVSTAITPAAAAKTPAALRLGVHTPAVAILCQAFSPSPYAPTPVPYSVSKGGSSGAAVRGAALMPHETSSINAEQGIGNPAGGAAAAAAPAAALSSRGPSGAGRLTRSLAHGTPVPKFSLTSPSMPPPVSKGSSSSSTLKLAPTPQAAAAAGGVGRAGAALMGAAPPAAAAVTQSEGAQQRCWNLQQSSASAQTPRVVQGLPSLSMLLAAAGSGNCSPEATAAAAATAAEHAVDTAAAADNQVELLRTDEHYPEDDVLMGLDFDDEPEATAADADADADTSPKENPCARLAPAACGTLQPKAVDLSSGPAPTATGVPAPYKNSDRQLQTASHKGNSAEQGSTAAADSSTSPSTAQQQQQQETTSGSSAGTPPAAAAPAATAAAATAETSKSHCTPAAAAAAAAGSSLAATGSSSGGPSSGSSSGCSTGGTRAVSAVSLKKLWRETHAAAMAAAAAAAAASTAAAKDASDTAADVPAAAAAAAAAATVSGTAGAKAAAADTPAAEPHLCETSADPWAGRKQQQQQEMALQKSEEHCVRSRSPDSLALACSAELLLLAAAAEDSIAAFADADPAAAADPAPAIRTAQKGAVSPAAGSAAGAAVVDTDELKAPCDAAGGGGGAAAAGAPGINTALIAAATAASAEAEADKPASGAAAKPRRKSSSSAGQINKVCAARVAVTAATSRQPHAVHAAPQRLHHLDNMPQPTVLHHVPPAPAATTGAAAAGVVAANAGSSAGQLASNCSSSLMLPPAAQMRLLQLQQQQGGSASAGAAAASAAPQSRMHPVPVVSPRVPHVLHPSHLPPPRASHSGGFTQRSGHVNPLGASTLNPGGVLPAWATAAPQQQQQQQQLTAALADPKVVPGAPAAAAVAGIKAGVLASMLAATETAAHSSAGARGAAAAAALNSLCSNSFANTAGGALLHLDIAPLHVPAPLSDAECWRLAQSQPWLIETVAAAARELLSGSAAGTAVGGAAAVSAAGAGGAGQTGNTGGSSSKGAAARLDGAAALRSEADKHRGWQAKSATVLLANAASNGIAAARAGAAAGHGCSGVKGPAGRGSTAQEAGSGKQQHSPLGARVLQARN